MVAATAAKEAAAPGRPGGDHDDAHASVFYVCGDYAITLSGSMGHIVWTSTFCLAMAGRGAGRRSLSIANPSGRNRLALGPSSVIFAVAGALPGPRPGQDSHQARSQGLAPLAACHVSPGHGPWHAVPHICLNV